MKKVVLCILAAICIALVFLLQSNSTNFRIGHRGWVAAHVLAIADKATPKNHFIGNTCNFETKGEKDYYYFDRYPLFFSAISSFVLSTQSLPGDKVLLSRQWMNLIYTLTFVLAFILIQLYFDNYLKSFALTLFIASGFFFIQFKDMFHFDQPALLGFMAFLLALKALERKIIKPWAIILVAIIASLMGRGYATCLAISFWFAFDSIIDLKNNGFKDFIKRFYKKTSFLTVLSVFIFSSLALFTNIYSEAQKRNIPLEKTSIVETAKHRTGMTNAYQIPWFSFTHGQVSRILKGSLPFPLNAIRKYKDFGPGGEAVFKQSIALKVILVICIIAYFLIVGMISVEIYKNRSKVKNKLKALLTPTNAIIALSGFAWMLPMKRLAGPHHYTNMYYIGFYIMVGVFLWSYLRTKKQLLVALTASIVLFVSSLSTAQIFYDAAETYEPNYTADFDSIRAVLDKSDIDSVEVDRSYREYVPGSPYALCFYLGDRFISDKSKWLISDEKDKEGYTNLTQDNKYYYLLELKESNLTM